MVAGYPMLAEAAIAAVEGSAAEARGLLARWRDLADRTGLASFRVGNEWAEERVEALKGLAAGVHTDALLRGPPPRLGELHSMG